MTMRSVPLHTYWRRLLTALVLLFYGTTAIAMDRSQAEVCLERYKSEAAAGADLLGMIDRYAANNELRRLVRDKMVVSDIDDPIVIDSVRMLRNSYSIGDFFEVNGDFRWYDGSRDYFALLIDKHCLVYRVGWNNVWLRQ